jgi:integrase
MRVRFPGVERRFTDYDKATRFLTGLRFEFDRGVFDPRDYAASNPLGFEYLISKWLERKKDAIGWNHYLNMRAEANRASRTWGNRNIKEIQYADVEDMLDQQALSSKSKHNLVSTLSQFFSWCAKRKYIQEMPELPTVEYELGYRKTVTKDEQDAILEEIGPRRDQATDMAHYAQDLVCHPIAVHLYRDAPG